MLLWTCRRDFISVNLVCKYILDQSHISRLGFVFGTFGTCIQLGKSPLVSMVLVVMLMHRLDFK